jgi:hypothetical protein
MGIVQGMLPERPLRLKVWSKRRRGAYGRGKAIPYWNAGHRAGSLVWRRTGPLRLRSYQGSKRLWTPDFELSIERAEPLVLKLRPSDDWEEV